MFKTFVFLLSGHASYFCDTKCALVGDNENKK